MNKKSKSPIRKGFEDSKRLDKLEKALQAGGTLDTYGWDKKTDKWGTTGFAIEMPNGDLDICETLREAIDKLEEQ